MGFQGYILGVPITALALPNIGPVTTSLLPFFAKRELTSAYQVYTDMRYWDPDGYSSYKNTNKKVHILEKVSLIKVRKKKQTKHRAIYYKLTSLGIFYVFYKGATLALELPDLFKNYEGDGLFNHLLYPYFEKDTLFNIRSSPMQSSIKQYLTASCKVIAQRAKNINNKFPGKKPVLRWEKNYEKQFHPEFLSYLECRFELSFDGKNLPLKRVNDNIIEIKDNANYISIELNPSKTKGSLFRNNNKIFEFDVLPSASSDIELGFWDPEGFTTISNFSQVRHFMFFALEAELMKMIFSWIVRSEYELSIGLWRSDLRNDLLVLSKDKKFILDVFRTLCNHLA